MYYYSITTIGDTYHEENEPYRHRTVGIFSDYQECLSVVKHNYGSLHEDGWYEWLVIEKSPYGLYPIPKETTWYEWKDDQWQQINDPPQFIKEYIKNLVSVGNIG